MEKLPECKRIHFWDQKSSTECESVSGFTLWIKKLSMFGTGLESKCKGHAVLGKLQAVP